MLAKSPQIANTYPVVLPDFAVPIVIISKPFFIAGQIYDCIFLGLEDCINDFQILKYEYKLIFIYLNDNFSA